MKRKLSLVFVIIGLLVTFNHCGMPGQGSGAKSSLTFGHLQAPSPSNVSNASTNLGNFSSTIWPVTNGRCVSCHGSSQQPLHASNDLEIAFDATVTGQKINISNPERSRLYLKLKEGKHNCWSDCDQNAAVMLQAIENYVRNASDNGSTDPGNGEIETIALGPLSDLQGELEAHVFTADQFMVTSPFVLRNEGGYQFFTTETNVGVLRANNFNGAGIAQAFFNNSVSGQYDVWALVNAPSGSDNSFHVKINDSKYYEWHIEETTGFQWRKLTETSGRNPVRVQIDANPQSRIEFRQREDGTSLVQAIITDQEDFVPDTTNISTKVNLRYDISSLLGRNNGRVMFLAEMREFDEYTYQVTNLRIQVNEDISVRLVAPKILVNGSHNSQHNTYNYVDQVFTQGETSVADYSMLVLKENGMEMDTFAWRFDQLSLE